MLIGHWLMLAAMFLVMSTMKRPAWLGGSQRRYTSDDTANAMLNRSSRQSLAGYLMLAGALLWLLGL